jgi:hypothetical protein
VITIARAAQLLPPTTEQAQSSCAHHLDALIEVCRIHAEVIGGLPGLK